MTNRTRCLSFLLGLGLFGCGDPTVAPARSPAVEYFERTAGTYEVTVVHSEDDCLLIRYQGPTLNDYTREDFHCTAQELEELKALLSDEDWATYLGDPSHGLGGAGGEGNVDPGDKEPLDREVDSPPNTAEYPIGYVQVDRLAWGSGNLDSKAFNADSTGPEAALIEYFQALNKKYVPRN